MQLWSAESLGGFHNLHGFSFCSAVCKKNYMLHHVGVVKQNFCAGSKLWWSPGWYSWTRSCPILCQVDSDSLKRWKDGKVGEVEIKFPWAEQKVWKFRICKMIYGDLWSWAPTDAFPVLMVSGPALSFSTVYLVQDCATTTYAFLSSPITPCQEYVLFRHENPISKSIEEHTVLPTDCRRHPKCGCIFMYFLTLAYKVKQDKTSSVNDFNT